MTHYCYSLDYVTLFYFPKNYVWHIFLFSKKYIKTQMNFFPEFLMFPGMHKPKL